eukprot:520569-Amphidinium_carterae.1
MTWSPGTLCVESRVLRGHPARSAESRRPCASLCSSSLTALFPQSGMTTTSLRVPLAAGTTACTSSWPSRARRARKM